MIRAWLAGVALAAFAIVPVGAQDAPPGSYQGTCTDIAVQNLLGGDGQNLQAQCQKHDGTPVEANLALPCDGDIRNENGVLVCHPGPNPFAPPPGPYQSKCQNANTAGPILRGMCMASDGSYVETAINVLECHGAPIDVGSDGKLTC
jgi:hypothetical protein